MFGKARQGAAAYAQVGIDSGVLAANPHQLIVLLFDGALLSIDTASSHMRNGDMEGKGHSISRAIEIVSSGLAASLDTGRGGEIAHNLAALYNYIGRQLVAANLNNDPAPLDEARRLLQQLKDAWSEISHAPRLTAVSASPTGA